MMLFMNFNKHSEFNGQHAFLSPSKYHWINYDEEKLINSYNKFLAAKKGTELHAFAKTCIELKQRLPSNRNTLNMYVNDAIGFRMIPEQVLYYSDNCYGTADTISFRENLLRIHDLKTGETPTSIHQLEVYAAIFCLEYKVNPKNISIILRIYQKSQILEHKPESSVISQIANKIVLFDKKIEKIKQEDQL